MFVLFSFGFGSDTESAENQTPPKARSSSKVRRHSKVERPLAVPVFLLRVMDRPRTPVYEKQGPKWCIASPGGPKGSKPTPGSAQPPVCPFPPDTGKPRAARRGQANPHGSGSVETPLSKHLLSQDSRLREAGAEVVYCLTRGAPKGPNLPRARLNHQDALFPGHGLATHSQTWDTRLREAGAEAVYCLARGAPKGPNIPRAQLNHQGPLFPGHGYATHSQTWVGEPTWLGVRSDATHQAPTKVGAPCVRVWWPTWLGSVVTLLTKHLRCRRPLRGSGSVETPLSKHLLSQGPLGLLQHPKDDAQFRPDSSEDEEGGSAGGPQTGPPSTPAEREDAGRGPKGSSRSHLALTPGLTGRVPYATAPQAPTCNNQPEPHLTGNANPEPAGCRPTKQPTRPSPDSASSGKALPHPPTHAPLPWSHSARGGSPRRPLSARRPPTSPPQPAAPSASVDASSEQPAPSPPPAPLGAHEDESCTVPTGAHGPQSVPARTAAPGASTRGKSPRPSTEGEGQPDIPTLAPLRSAKKRTQGQPQAENANPRNPPPAKRGNTGKGRGATKRKGNAGQEPGGSNKNNNSAAAANKNNNSTSGTTNINDSNKADGTSGSNEVEAAAAYEVGRYEAAIPTSNRYSGMLDDSVGAGDEEPPPESLTESPAPINRGSQRKTQVPNSPPPPTPQKRIMIPAGARVTVLVRPSGPKGPIQLDQ
ncbi:hypothetical protein ISCGN_005381 [Ixodes scapularis]